MGGGGGFFSLFADRLESALEFVSVFDGCLPTAESCSDPGRADCWDMSVLLLLAVRAPVDGAGNVVLGAVVLLARLSRYPLFSFPVEVFQDA